MGTVSPCPTLIAIKIDFNIQKANLAAQVFAVKV